MQVRTNRLLLTVKEAAMLCGLNPRQLYELSSRPGAIPAGVVIRIGRRIRISRSRLFDWIGKPDDCGSGPQEEEPYEWVFDQPSFSNGQAKVQGGA